MTTEESERLALAENRKIDRLVVYWLALLACIGATFIYLTN
jgi:hypothetical protein